MPATTGIGATPGDAALRIDPLEVAHQQQPEILPRLQRGPAVIFVVELDAERFDEWVEAAFGKYRLSRV